MKRDLVCRECKSSFQSCDKDTETILRKLFVTSQPYSNELKKLLIVNTKDCLDNANYNVVAEQYDLARLIEEQYIRLSPKFRIEEHGEVKSYIHLSFCDFTPNGSNPQFRDCSVVFDIICHSDYWDVGNYRQRPIKILGIIDGLLNDSKLSGIGTLNFLGATNFTLDETYSGYTLMYRAVHGSDDKIPAEEI